MLHHGIPTANVYVITRPLAILHSILSVERISPAAKTKNEEFKIFKKAVTTTVKIQF